MELQDAIVSVPKTMEKYFGYAGKMFKPSSDTVTSLINKIPVRALILASDDLLIASPEYAHAVTGAIKNALDWRVGNESFVNKPVAFLI